MWGGAVGESRVTDGQGDRGSDSLWTGPCSEVDNGGKLLRERVSRVSWEQDFSWFSWLSIKQRVQLSKESVSRTRLHILCHPCPTSTMGKHTWFHINKILMTSHPRPCCGAAAAIWIFA